MGLARNPWKMDRAKNHSRPILPRPPIPRSCPHICTLTITDLRTNREYLPPLPVRDTTVPGSDIIVVRATTRTRWWGRPSCGKPPASRGLRTLKSCRRCRSRIGRRRNRSTPRTRLKTTRGVLPSTWWGCTTGSRTRVSWPGLIPPPALLPLSLSTELLL